MCEDAREVGWGGGKHRVHHVIGALLCPVGIQFLHKVDFVLTVCDALETVGTLNGR